MSARSPEQEDDETLWLLPDEAAAGLAQAVSRSSLSIQALPEDIRANYEIHEWRHACAVLRNDFPDEYTDVIDVLGNFRLWRSHVLEPGGRKSEVAKAIDGAFFAKYPAWQEKQFQTQIVSSSRSLAGVDERSTTDSPTHAVDCFRNGIALEVEWNSKDSVFDRDLNNFRLLFDLRVVSVGIIVTRCDHLQRIFNELDRGKSYGASTTHMSKLLPKLEGGGGGGCPVLVFGISERLYDADR